jgi:hypothetical protein
MILSMKIGIILIIKNCYVSLTTSLARAVLVNDNYYLSFSLTAAK